MVNSKYSKYLALAVISLALVTQVSCKKEDGTGDIDVVLIPSNITAIPVSGKACNDPETEVPATYINIPTFKYTWKTDPSETGTVQLEIVSITLQSGFLSGDGIFSKVLGGDELDKAVGAGKTILTPNVTVTADCGIRVGGISFRDGVKQASLSGYVKLLGTNIKSDGSTDVVTAEAPITVEYTAF